MRRSSSNKVQRASSHLLVHSEMVAISIGILHIRQPQLALELDQRLDAGIDGIHPAACCLLSLSITNVAKGSQGLTLAWWCLVGVHCLVLD